MWFYVTTLPLCIKDLSMCKFWYPSSILKPIIPPWILGTAIHFCVPL